VIQRKLLQGLENATPAQLAEAEIVSVHRDWVGGTEGSGIVPAYQRLINEVIYLSLDNGERPAKTRT